MQEHTSPPKTARDQRKAPQPMSVLESPDTLLTIATVSAATGLSESAIYRLANKGELVPKRLGIRCTRWRSADVKAWLVAQSAA